MAKSSKEESAKKFLESKEHQVASTPEENQPKETSLGKLSSHQTRDDGPAIPTGYQEIYAENFPSKGRFYKEGTRFFIRPAGAGEIREFSGMNEEDPFSVNDGLNSIIKGCLTIRGGKVRHTFKDVLEEDRVYILLEIRQLTFVKGENKVVIPIECRDCGTLNEIEIENSVLVSRELDENLLKYLDEKTGVLNVKTKSFGVIKIKPPTIGIASKVLDYIQAERAARKKPDPTFVKIAPYLIEDWRSVTDTLLPDLYMQYINWSREKVNFMYSLVEKMRVGVSEELRSSCTKCQAVIESPIAFPGGIKTLFLVSDIADELL